MVDVMTYSIGELAELTGLSVKTIRFYSDRGVVPPSDRTPRGYRRYDASALARLELVRTLRDLGLDLATIQHVLASEISLPDVLVTHASALDTQLRVLRTRRAVVRAAIARSEADNREAPADHGPADLESLHRLARLTDSERQSLTNNFLTAVFNRTSPTAGGGESGVYQAATPDAHLERAADPRRDRYFELLAVINGWPRPSASGPAVRWFLAARQAAATR